LKKKHEKVEVFDVGVGDLVDDSRVAPPLGCCACPGPMHVIAPINIKDKPIGPTIDESILEQSIIQDFEIQCYLYYKVISAVQKKVSQKRSNMLIIFYISFIATKT
jgi:hypothetical protein